MGPYQTHESIHGPNDLELAGHFPFDRTRQLTIVLSAPFLFPYAIKMWTIWLKSLAYMVQSLWIIYRKPRPATWTAKWFNQFVTTSYVPCLICKRFHEDRLPFRAKICVTLKVGATCCIHHMLIWYCVP